MQKETTNSLIVRTRAVQTPFAQTAIPSGLQSSPNPIVARSLSLSGVKSTLPMELKVLIHLQLMTGLRISEILNITAKDLKSYGRILINTLKKGKPRLVYYVDSYGYLDKCRALSVQPFANYDRYFIYRLYKKNGIQLATKMSSKMSVTHAFRHLIAMQLAKEVESTAIVSQVLGHSSINSIANYV